MAKKLDEKRDSALKTALATIERAHGKGAIMSLGEGAKIDIDVVSTGSLGLDKALGIGGLPRGRIVEIYGPESSGKCLTKDTMVMTEDGILTIEELFKENDCPITDCKEREAKIIEKQVFVLNEKGLFEKTSHFTFNGKKEVLKLQSALGNEIRITHNHPVRFMNGEGDICWYKPENNVFTEGSINFYLPIMIGNRIFSDNNNSLPTKYESMVDYIREIIPHNEVPIEVRKSSQSIQTLFFQTLFGLYAFRENDNVMLTAEKTFLLNLQAMLFNFGYISIVTPHKDKWFLVIPFRYRSLCSGVNDSFMAMFHLAYVRHGAPVGYENIPYDSQAFALSTSNSSPGVPNLAFKFKTLESFPEVQYLIANDMELQSISVSFKDADYVISYSQLEHIINQLATIKFKHDIFDYFIQLCKNRYVYSNLKHIETPGKGVFEETYDICLPDTHTFWSNGLISHNTTLTLHTIAECQKMGGTCAFIDAEHALDPAYAKRLGVNIDELLISQPDNGEQALEIADTLARSGAVDIIVVDSVAALIPRAELEGEMGDSHVGLHARLMSQALRKLTGTVSRTNTMVIMINQIRQKIGISFGSNETTTGGNALKFYASVRLDIRRIGSIKNKDEVVGNQTRVKVVKNKMAPPFRQAEFDIMYNKGIRRTAEILDECVKLNIIEKSGAWFSFDSQRIGQGRDNSIDFIDAHPEIKAKLEELLGASHSEPALCAPVDEEE